MRLAVIFVVLFLCIGNLFGQDKVVDSLEIRLSEASTELEQVQLYNAISDQYKYSDPNKMLSFGSKAFKLAEKNQMKLEMGVAYLNMGTAYIILGDYEKAMDHFVWAKSVFEELSKSSQSNREIDQGIARALGSMGIVYSEQSNYSKALQYYLEGAKVYEKLNDKGAASKFYNNIGVVYKSQDELEKALEYFLKAEAIQKERKDPNSGITQTNIANIYFKQGKLDEAFKYYSAAKVNIGLHPNPRALGEWYNNIGAYYNTRKYPEMALENWEKAVLTFKEIDDKFGLADTYLHLAEFHTLQNNKTEALEAANNALALANKTQVLEQIVVAEKLLSEIYSQSGNMEKALLHFKNHSAAKDSLYKQNDVRKAVETAMNYEFEKKELLQKEENQKRELLLKEEAKSTNLKLLFGALIALLLFGIGFLIYNRHQLKKTLTLQKELAEYEQKALHLQMNPHFVFNCLGSISSFIVQNGTDSAIKYLSKFSKLMRLTLEYSKESLIPIDKEIESLQNYLELEQLRFNDKFNFSITKDSNIEDDVALPPLLIQPFIENAIIHGVVPKSQNGNISIAFSVTNVSLICTIVDDGVGINQSIKNKENSVLAHKSMALGIIKKRLEMIAETTGKEALITIEEIIHNEEISGTKIKLTLPLQYATN
ncbi:tetratricopeptide repeat-containing sensor histidine kinase [Aequorivita viscosa]|uniref:Tetratricopeptide repeat-containing protein n=1 Tax=Aequorivita viscosa TaxID=797419 RepID=A0A1M6DRI1_9FLAO|nr:tetratricopeptide repeat protein [Aequorivita viscosa]SDW49947.1 Tetratricopeptide repeat-containing protein [Aequorivita viscosa]SHI75739.1 Tetratricopeptide repeat-containing protein [Aequorivita viscosa]